jgi:hypothetical protein
MSLHFFFQFQQNNQRTSELSKLLIKSTISIFLMQPNLITNFSFFFSKIIFAFFLIICLSDKNKSS